MEEKSNQLLPAQKTEHSSAFSYRNACRIIFSRWQWLVISLLIAVTGGSFYIWLAEPVYITSASIKIEDRRSALSELVSIRNLYDKNSRAETESFIIQSGHVLRAALNSLRYPVSFFRKDGFFHKNAYPEKLLDIRPIAFHVNIPPQVIFTYTPVDNQKYQLEYIDQHISISRNCQFGDTVNTSFVSFIINKAPGCMQACGFSFNDPEACIPKLSGRLKVNGSQASNIISLRFSDHNPRFAADFLNAVLQQYLVFDKAQRSSSMDQTAQFIAALLPPMSVRISTSGKNIQELKNKYSITDLTGMSGTIANELSRCQISLQQLKFREISLKAFRQQLELGTQTNQLYFGPAEPEDPILQQLVNKRNEIMIRQKQQLSVYTAEAPEVIRTEQDLQLHNSAIIKSITSALQRNKNMQHVIVMKTDSIQVLLSRFPAIERELAEFQSSFNVNQKVHDFLSEKKLEAQISGKTVIPGAVIIDGASLPQLPVSPNAISIYAFSTLIALSSGILVIFSVHRLNPYLYNKESLSENSALPILGPVRKYHAGHLTQLPVLDDPRSLFTESIRSVRSGLSFFASEESTKLICITSHISGEGKTFISANLAISLSMIGKRVVLIAADMRRSYLHNCFGLQGCPGLSEFLSGQTGLTDIIQCTKVSGLDFIASGQPPPNPSELMHVPNLKTLVASLKEQYDIVLTDCAPAGLVTDSLPLLKTSDICLFLLRSGVSKRTFISAANTLQSDLGLTNFALLLNDYKEDGFHSSLYHTSDISYANHQQQYFLS
ncbi:polysaccharide biosynthesis tyrosine autokinase [Pedobacter sp. JY14-1]|uniref:GumC family protein n=1 Tax=Pedobacter sp. JY14-1 TaxID=3034151 RepID=UPI0023E0DB0D|nr:polysaccharide biosynthesis tyrosine autokinase [Pedobacter sp. JY14-1]